MLSQGKQVVAVISVDSHSMNDNQKTGGVRIFVNI
jgi:hypothetical protein